jgi:excisionase family DNA binding protein
MQMRPYGGKSMDKLLYTPAEACRVLNMSRSKLYQELGSGRLAWVNNGRRRFVHKDELSRYAAALVPEYAG